VEGDEMKKYLKIVIPYFVITAIAIAILSEILKSTRIFTYVEYLSPLAMCAMLCHIGAVMQNKFVKKKYFFYLSIIIGEGILFNVFFITLNANGDSWIFVIGFAIIFLTLLIMLFDMAKTVKDTNKKVSWILSIIAFVCVVLGIPIFIIQSVLSLAT
jgi:hypothetical protein